MRTSLVILGVVSALFLAGAVSGAGLDWGVDEVGARAWSDSDAGSGYAALADILGTVGLDAATVDLVVSEQRSVPWDAAKLARYWGEQYPLADSFSFAALFGISQRPASDATPPGVAQPDETEASADWTYRPVTWQTDPLGLKTEAAPAQDAKATTPPNLLDTETGRLLDDSSRAGTTSGIYELASRVLSRPFEMRDRKGEYGRTSTAATDGQETAAVRTAAALPTPR